MEILSSFSSFEDGSCYEDDDEDEETVLGTVDAQLAFIEFKEKRSNI